jgi:hypothetical protein
VDTTCLSFTWIGTRKIVIRFLLKELTGTGAPTWSSAPTFLQMHHEMVKATDNEPKYHILHQS